MPSGQYLEKILTRNKDFGTFYKKQTDWTPTLYGSVTAGSPTYASQFGTYCVIGDMVFFNGTIRLSAKNDIDGHLHIGGLPEDVASGSKSSNGMSFGYIDEAGTIVEDVMGIVQYGGNFAKLYHLATGQASSLTDNEILDGLYLIFSGHYKRA